jgi:hypothetical protein
MVSISIEFQLDGKARSVAGRKYINCDGFFPTLRRAVEQRYVFNGITPQVKVKRGQEFSNATDEVNVRVALNISLPKGEVLDPNLLFLNDIISAQLDELRRQKVDFLTNLNLEVLPLTITVGVSQLLWHTV